MERFVKIVNRFEIFGRVLNTPLISDNPLYMFKNDTKISRKKGLGKWVEGPVTGAV